MKNIIAYTTGEALGNPGKAAAAVIITADTDKILSEIAQPLGNGTRDFAAYYAVHLALQAMQQYVSSTTQVSYTVYLDNTFVYEQLVGKRPMKEPGLVPLFIEIHNLRIESFPDISFKNISTTENQKVIDPVTTLLRS